MRIAALRAVLAFGVRRETPEHLAKMSHDPSISGSSNFSAFSHCFLPLGTSDESFSKTSDTALLILGQGKPAERWTLKFDGEKLDVRAELGEGPEITIGGEMDR
jgi:hypothetical protein